jgi:hypothetical protein
MSGPLAIGMTLGGLLCGLPAPRRKPRFGAETAPSLLSRPAGPRTPRRLWTTDEHDVVSLVGGPR